VRVRGGSGKLKERLIKRVSSGQFGTSNWTSNASVLATIGRHVSRARPSLEKTSRRIVWASM
jgi:hypothetical protein